MTNIFKQVLYCTSCIILPSIALAKVTPIQDYKADLRDTPSDSLDCEKSIGIGWSSSKTDAASCISQQLPDGTKCYKCTCDTTFKLSSCPSHGACTVCLGKYRLDSCASGYLMDTNKTSCDADCGSYPITGNCPTGGTCSNCPNDSSKKKLDSCDTSKGWKKDRNTCTKIPCSAGSPGVTGCNSASTKPDYKSFGYSGGEICGTCTCLNVNSNCTAANYPLSTEPTNSYSVSCTTGCGSERVTRYKVTSCLNDYKLSGNTCVLKECADYGYEVSHPVGSVCDTQTPRSGLTCYSNCTKCEDYDYVATIPANHICKAVTPRPGLTCYRFCQEEPCGEGYIFIGNTCEKTYNNCAEAGFITASDVWVSEGGDVKDGCSALDKTYGRPLISPSGGTLSCYMPFCGEPEINTGTGDGGTGTGTGGGFNLSSGRQPCGSDGSGNYYYYCFNTKALPTLAQNILSQKASGFVSLYTLSDEECFAKYVKPLEMNDDDDFVVYA